MRMEKIRKLILCPGEFWREEDVRSLKDVLLSFPLLLFSYIVTFGGPRTRGLHNFKLVHYFGGEENLLKCIFLPLYSGVPLRSEKSPF